MPITKTNAQILYYKYLNGVYDFTGILEIPEVLEASVHIDSF